MDNALRICSVSGGKDSTALYCWMIEQFGKDGFLAVFADTGNEHPATLNYIRNLPQMADGPAIKWVTANFETILERKGSEPSDSVFLDLCIGKGRVPSAGAQFCTENLKLAPIRAWLDTIRGDREVIMYTGIRRGESLKRSTYPKSEHLAYYNAMTERPLIDWSTEDIFAYLEKKGVPPNPLYEAGFPRVGCFPCIHARKSDLARLPEWAWEKITEWETKIGRSWFPFGLIPLTQAQKLEYAALPKIKVCDASGNGEWIKEPSAEAEWKNRNAPTIQEVREWAKTTRGGSQFDMFPPDESDVPGCVSTWGICE